MKWYESCSICPRSCGADRRSSGACRAVVKEENGKLFIPVARAALHYWEEPCISGRNGSGTVFFSGCSLGCIFCQNREISTGESGKYIDGKRLSDIFLELGQQGANNINLVTAGHVLPVVIEALEDAKSRGLDIPVLYNTSSYESVKSLKMLEGLVDIYMPDMKYISPLLSKSFSLAGDYPDTAKEAIDEMYRQTGRYVIGEDGLMKRGVLIRHLVLPGCSADSKKVISYLYGRYGDEVIYSIMNQYTPMRKDFDIPVLNRRVRKSEYASVIEYALSIGITRAYMQSEESATESFIPPFDLTGV